MPRFERCWYLIAGERCCVVDHQRKEEAHRRAGELKIALCRPGPFFAVEAGTLFGRLGEYWQEQAALVRMRAV